MVKEGIGTFQFQYGAIGRDITGTTVSDLSRFQFQCGAIGRLCQHCETKGRLTRFNSSVVRLVDAIASNPRLRVFRFNSSVVRLVAGKYFVIEFIFKFQF